MKGNDKKILIAIAVILVAFAGSSLKIVGTGVPSESESVVFANHLDRLENLGVLLRLPTGWEVVSTTRSALTLHNEKGEQTHVLFEPEDYYYHNPSAKVLEDYWSSYRGRGIDVVIDSTTSSVVGGEPALFQTYRAGDAIDGELTSRSLASIPQSSPRYVLRHPRTGEFLIISGEASSLKFLQDIVSGLEFIGT